MNQSMFTQSSAYSFPSYIAKNTRLYQQLLQNNYLSDNIYTPPTSASLSAAITYVSPPTQSKYQLCMLETNGREEIGLKSPKYVSPFKAGEGTKNSLQITQSLTSNYSIMKIENESHSSINLYNLSRNIESDSSFSSNSITAKLHNDDSHLYIPESSNNSGMLREETANREQQMFQLESQQMIRKYRSEEYLAIVSKDTMNQQQDENESPLPRLLANKYIKNEVSRKFSTSNNGQLENSNFKTFLNQIHVVPYRINQQVQPYAFTIPYGQTNSNMIQKRGKANSLNLQASRFSNEREEERATKTLYFSNHLHHSSHNNQQAPRLQFYISTYNTPTLSQANKPVKQVTKNGDKLYHLSNQNTARSNSIQCKDKPNTSFAKKQQYHENQPKELLEQSKVEKIYRDADEYQEAKIFTTPYNQSVIYDQAEISVCCGITRYSPQSNANRIIFKQKEDPKCISFCDKMSLDAPHLSKAERGLFYKINPVKMIKSYDQTESENQKKGIKLVGFNSSCKKKNEE